MLIILDRAHTIFTEYWSRQNIMQDLPIFFKRTFNLLPSHELADLLCQLPEFLKIGKKICTGQSKYIAIIKRKEQGGQILPNIHSQTF